MQLDVGSELRRARESRKLSLRDVASAVGVSASLLSQVETGKTQPSVSTLYGLVTYLGVSLDGLMGTAHREPASPAVAAPARDGGTIAPEGGVVQRRRDNPVIEMENGVTWERLAVGESAVADPLVVTYAPRASSSMEGKMMRHAGLEYGVLQEGRLTLKIDFDTYELEPGDSFCFDSGRPHLYVNETDQPARGIWFVIGRRDMAYQSLADLGHDQPLERRTIASAVDVLAAMKAMRS
ncbi:cupin domain-containing protein [Microbacterium invictum]|uniref:Cupin domain-containing protein n=1 Tax=Microbacterium invictum TaxID=515415 RepID=A0ABZ0V9I7_9MICO|nr:cupin domain-containing protein [Microbacterium invictum]WQB69909.1 cupin domain-containing protein [Microbacterium invictum]